MSDNDHNANSSRQKPEHLLDELESIKGVLTNAESSALVGDIPLLDDMVIGHLDDNAKLLNLHRIFEEDIDAEFGSIDKRVQFPRFQLDVTVSDDEIGIPTTPSIATVSSSDGTANDSRDLLIQALVDEFTPQIEAALRARLAQLDFAALSALKGK